MLDVYSGKDRDRNRVQLDQKFVDCRIHVSSRQRLLYAIAKMMVGADMEIRFENANAAQKRLLRHIPADLTSCEP